jgi:hypothetical protein
MASGVDALQAAGTGLTAAQASQLSQVHSDVILVDSGVDVIQSDVADGTLSDITSKLVVVEDFASDTYSRLLEVESEIDSVLSAGGVISDIASGVDAIQAAGGGLTVAQASQLSQVHSDVILVDSGVDVIQSDVADGTLSDITSKLVVVEDFASDTYSRLLEVESEIDSVLGAGGVVSDIASGVDAIQAAGGGLTAAQASQLSQVHSDTILIDSGVDVIQSDVADGTLSDITSKLVVVEDFASDTYSRLLEVESEIDSILGAGGVISDIASKLVVVDAVVDGIDSELDEILGAGGVISDMASGVDALQAAGGGLTAAQASQLSQVHSDAIDIYSDTAGIESELDSILGAGGVISDMASGVDAIQAAGGGLTAAQASQLSQVHSDAIDIYSDTAGIESELDSILGAGGVISNIASGVDVIQSDVADGTLSNITSKLVVIDGVADGIASDIVSILGAGGVVSDMASGVDAIQAAGGALTAAQASQLSQVHSDAILIDSGVDAIQAAGGSLTAAQASQLSQVHSDTMLLDSAQSEPTGVPAVNETPLEKLAYLFMGMRNKVTVSSSAKTFYDNGGAAEFSKALSDDGTTYTEAEVSSG